MGLRIRVSAFALSTIVAIPCLAQQPPCTAPTTWFPHSRTPEPDAGAFSSSNNCEFHQWAWQEFLWLTQDVGNGRLRFMQFKTPADLRADSPPPADSISRDRPLVLRPRFPKPFKATNPREVAQASGDIMVGPNGRAIYYGTFINDTFYKFVTDPAHKYIDPKVYKAASRDVTFPVGTLEIKSSWMIVDPEKAPAGYYTTNALVQPLKIGPNPTNLVPPPVVEDTQAKPLKVRVALVGLHVVGVVKGHPEFVWATFEPAQNAPDLPSSITDPQQSDAPVSSSNFTFYAANTPAMNCNVPNATRLLLGPGQTLRPITNTFRWVPDGGGPPDNQANIDALNASVKAGLGDDPFADYKLVGALWSTGVDSLFPKGSTDPNASLPSAASQIGSTSLANTTMETFFQAPASSSQNCFTCHNTGPFPNPGNRLPTKNMNLSHIMMQLLTEKSAASHDAANSVSLQGK